MSPGRKKKTVLVGLRFCCDESDNKRGRWGWYNLYIKNTFSAKRCAIVQYVKYTVRLLFRKNYARLFVDRESVVLEICPNNDLENKYKQQTRWIWITCKG